MAYIVSDGVIDNPGIDINLMLNGGNVGACSADERDSSISENLSVQATLSLTAGSKIWIQISYVRGPTRLSDNVYHFTHFSGWLLEEDIRSSLL